MPFAAAPFAAALSEHPVPAHATGEVIGEVLEAVGKGPDLAVLFVTAAHAGALEDIARAVRVVLAPSRLLGCTTTSLVGRDREVEEQPAIVLWAGATGPVAPVHLRAEVGGTDPDDVGTRLRGLPDDVPAAGTLLLLADPFSFPTTEVVAGLGAAHPGLTVAGGIVASARAPGGNRMLLDDRVHHDGAVGVLLPPGAVSDVVVSQGCRPIGDPWVVTRAERNVIYELGGRPALERLTEALDVLGDGERRAAARGLQIGLVVDESRAEFGRGDFLVRAVLGGDRTVGAVAVGDAVAVGGTVQFQVRDADAADEDLRAALAGRRGAAALVFTCTARGTHLFGGPDHDAGLVATVAGPATAGLFCAGEIGPVGGRSHVHGSTASVLLFSGDRGR